MVFNMIMIFLAMGATLVAAQPKQNTEVYSVLDFSTKFEEVITIAAPISLDAGDQYASVAAQIIGGWKLWQNWVNVNPGNGITVNGMKYGVQLALIEDYSNCNNVTSAVTQALASKVFNSSPDFFFAPYGSALTLCALTQTETAAKNIFASTSSSTAIWQQSSNIQYGFTTLYASNTWYAATFAYYKNAGASTAAYFCNACTDCTDNTCGFGGSSQSSLTSTFQTSDITLEYYYAIDTTSASYQTDLANAVGQAQSGGVDLVVIMDYSTLCLDFPGAASAAKWTPKGMMLVFCANNAAVVAEMGSNIQYATTYTAWSAQGTQTASTGVTNQQFAAAYESQFGTAPLYQAAEGYAGGEVLYQAIVGSNSLDAATIANWIVGETNGIQTIMSSTKLKFPTSTHQAIGSWDSLQFNSAGSAILLGPSSQFTYPMPAWDARTSASAGTPTMAPVACSTTNNNQYNTDDTYSKEQATGLAVTAIFCFLGGIVTAIILTMWVPKYFGVTTAQKAETEMTSVTNPTHSNA